MPELSKGIICTGATSAIVLPLLRHFAKEGCSFALAGRNQEKLQLVRKDLLSHHAGEVFIHTWNPDQMESPDCWDALWRKLTEAVPDATTLILAQGTMSSARPESPEEAFGELCEAVRVNFLSVAGIARLAAEDFAARGGGQIIALSSVAGDRGRPSNYTYGSSKAALNAWLEGLRAHFFPKKVKVMTVKPGMTRTPMTRHMKDSPLFSEPEVVARAILRALEKGRDTVYAPAFWFAIMLVIRLIPGFIFKRLHL